ncbi:MAG: phage portal protein [Aestuariibacter sp.]|nr:phage portal protein [Aestuariibacter sp.]
MANRIENLITAISPSWGLKRAQDKHNLQVVNQLTSTHRATSGGGYGGGRYGRNRAVPSRSTMEEDIAAGWTYHNMIANSMQLYRDEPMAKSVVDVCSTYMGESRPTATTTDPAWNALATEYFNDVWWDQADARGRSGSDFGEMQVIWDKWCWLGGDMLYLPFDGALLPYEGLQINTPSKLRADKQIINGLRVGASAPWPVTHYYINDASKKDGYQRIAANEAIFAAARPWRTSMLRGVPDLHGVIDSMYRFGEISDNVARRIEFESKMYSVEKKGALGNVPGGKLISNASADGTDLTTSKAAYGTRLMINGEPDKDFKLLEMKNPNSNYVAVMEAQARHIAAGTGFPYEIVMHIYTSGSYTANRAARLDFAKALMSRWSWRNKVLNQRVYNWKIAQAVNQGILPPAPVNESNGLSQWNKCSWSLPHFPHIDEGKEVVADIKQWGCGQESIGDWAQQKGMTRDQMLDAHDKDIAEMQKRAAVLNIPFEQYMPQLFTASAAPDEQPDNDDDTPTKGKPNNE